MHLGRRSFGTRMDEARLRSTQRSQRLLQADLSRSWTCTPTEDNWSVRFIVNLLRGCVLCGQLQQVPMALMRRCKRRASVGNDVAIRQRACKLRQSMPTKKAGWFAHTHTNFVWPFIDLSTKRARHRPCGKKTQRHRSSTSPQTHTINSGILGKYFWECLVLLWRLRFLFFKFFRRRREVGKLLQTQYGFCQP